MRELFTILFLLAAIPMCFGQILIKLKQPPPNQLRATDIWNVSVTNQSRSDIEIYLRGTVDEATDGQLVVGSCGTFLLKARETKNITVGNIPGGGKYSWSNTKYQDQILRTGSAGSGSYTICIYAKDGTGRDLGQDCIQQSVAVMSPPMLVSPGDGETIPEGQMPTFTWLPLAQAPRDVRYTIRISEIIGTQSPEEAIQRNPTWFEKGDIRTTTLQYPTGARKLETGKKYVWIVSHGVEQSIVFSFAMGVGAQLQSHDLSNASTRIRSEVHAQLVKAAAEAKVKIDDDDFVYFSDAKSMAIGTFIAGVSKLTSEEMNRSQDILFLYLEGTAFPNGYYVLSVGSMGANGSANLKGTGGSFDMIPTLFPKDDDDEPQRLKIVYIKSSRCLIIETSNWTGTYCCGSCPR